MYWDKRYLCLQLILRRYCVTQSYCILSNTTLALSVYVSILPLSYFLPSDKMMSIHTSGMMEKKAFMLSTLQALHLCSSIPFLPFSVFTALALERMRDVPPFCAFGGQKRGLRRKLCLSFSFWSFSQPSARSFALGSSFHFGLGLVWFGFWNTGEITGRF